MGTRSRASARTDDDAQSGEREHEGLTVAMRRSLVAVGLAVLVGLVWALWVSQLSPVGSSGPQGSPVTTEATDGVGHDDDGLDDAPGRRQDREVAAAATPLPDPTPVDGSEVPAPDPQRTQQAHLPPLPQPTPLVSAPLPDDGVAEGELVEGFPIAVAGPADGSTIIHSSIAHDRTTMQVALTARTAQTPEQLVTHYTRLWTDLRLAPTAGTEAALAYADRYSSISLTITESGTGTLYTLFATLRTA